MTTVEMPAPGMPEPGGEPVVEFLEPDFARWTFRTDDPALQCSQNYWRGWYGFEEEDEPHSIEGRVWLVRRQK